VKLHRKSLGLALGAALLTLTAGCGGINASKSVSPLDFFLPGLLQADPPPAQPDRLLPTNEPVQQVAQAR
jgi:hypothetical protein